MKKITVAVLTACFLFCLAGQWTAQATSMNQVEKRPGVIEISIVNGRINMGEKYAYAVHHGDTIIWTCDYPFAVQFNWNAPFEPVKVQAPKAIGKKVKAEAVPCEPYKYVIAVCYKGEVLTLDPIIIVIPPEERQSR
jgi:hypothetical protein